VNLYSAYHLKKPVMHCYWFENFNDYIRCL